MALAVSLAYPWHPAWVLACLGSAPATALGWVEGPGHFPSPLLLQTLAPGVLQRVLPWRMYLPLGLEKLCASLVYGSLGTGHASLGASPGAAVAVGMPAFSRFHPIGYPTQPFNVLF